MSASEPIFAVYKYLSGEGYDAAYITTHLERDVIVPNSDLQLLLPHDVLLRPVRVLLLHNLARLDDALHLLHHQR